MAALAQDERAGDRWRKYDAAAGRGPAAAIVAGFTPGMLELERPQLVRADGLGQLERLDRRQVRAALQFLSKYMQDEAPARRNPRAGRVWCRGAWDSA